ncbi:proteasome assembly chaperone 2 isoform X1 [Selaginella moellendorffii]|uniref:proteasome assembly chaperone 2 isoform X1 n=1 Tax=Selaginella moellendorffii TaxID=88036 RepID=UPI000D1C4171|nr:proteasome assembly chaperone 2 isoform X1 [Selaginella moellendorffii]|eukprot:XP_024531095.1 proteasome assembly chaperone 2 isoform X1 [Selaginella moellendorffii]
MEFCGDRARLRRKALVLPALSIGNAGQLAVDLLISTYGMPRVGFLDDPHVLPCVGNDPFGPEPRGELAVAMELYVDSASDITVLQQRSPLVKGSTLKFAENLADWAKSEGFENVVVLSGLDSGKRHLLHNAGPQVYYQTSASEDGKDELCERLGWLDVKQSGQHTEPFEFSVLRDAMDGRVGEHDQDYLSRLPVTALFTSFKKRGLKVLSVLCYCAEGDNIPDATFLASACDKFFHSCNGMSYRSWINHANYLHIYAGKECKNWRIPLSWSTVYGAPPDLSIY